MSNLLVIIAIVLVALVVIAMGFLCATYRLEIERLREDRRETRRDVRGLVKDANALLESNECLENRLKAAEGTIAWLLFTKEEALNRKAS